MYVVLVGLHPVEPRGFDEFGGSVAKRLSSPPAGSYPEGKAVVRSVTPTTRTVTTCAVGCRWEGIVPLSEHEQRVLEQIERSLYADDPKFAATVRGIDPRARQRRRYARSVVGAIVGLALLPVGIAIDQIEVTFAGFLLALIAFLYGVAAWRRGPEHSESGGVASSSRAVVRRGRLRAGRTGRTPSVPKRPIMQRFEDRWNRRRES